MSKKNKLLSVLSDAEQEALYGLPEFDDAQQLEYLAVTETELALANSRPSLHAKVYCLLQIGYFKAKHAFFSFDWDEVEDDCAFVLSRYFHGEVFEPKAITKHERYTQREQIAKLFGYQGGKFRDKEDELSSMFKDNCFEQFVPECLVKGKTMVFCAGTGAGKTTFANACLQYIPHHLRCISIEDTDEAKFRFHKNHVKLYYPSEGESSTVSSASLLRSGFRMNPDRILMTEVRGAEAWDFLKGSSSGHAGNLTTVHESTPEDAVLGLVQRCYMNPECQNLPYNIILRRVLSNVDVIMSIKYIDEEDNRFASGIYYRDIHFQEYFEKLKE
ncbi:hypothetical protein C1677_24380 [Klebsiella pneumoniae]|nr:hypothetical protein C1677_24380 [Klebsiella pneumoniae]